MDSISTALSSVSTLLGMARLAVDARDDAKVRTALIEMQQKLLDAMTSALASAEKMATLQAELRTAEESTRALQTQIDDRGCYQLFAIRPGLFVYKTVPQHASDATPTHYLCQPCYDKGVRSVLRQIHGDRHMRCPEEPRHTFPLEPAPAHAQSGYSSHWQR